MRLAWVSFDVMGRDCLAAAAEAGADVVALVTLPGPVDLEEPAAAGMVVGMDGEAAVVACGQGGLVLEEVEGVDGLLLVSAHFG